jgi:hypothetical protein
LLLGSTIFGRVFRKVIDPVFAAIAAAREAHGEAPTWLFAEGDEFGQVGGTTGTPVATTFA